MKLGGVQVAKSGSMPSSSSHGSTQQFPAGLRVLVVDDDPTCLMILEKMLRTCHYEATKCNRAEIALNLLRENRNGYDIVLSDVHMPDMDGFKLLEHIGLEMDLPVIMMSADDSKNVVMKGVTHGACDYLIKPVRLEALKNIWQHVVRRKKHVWKDIEQSGSVEDGKLQQQTPDDADYLSSANEGSWRNSKRRKDEEEDADDRDDDTSSLKKPRVVWSVELHQQFVAAANQLGIDKAVPKKILELMNVPGLTRENVASHLQKYRLYLRRLSGQHQNALNGSFMGNPEATYGSISSFNDLELQAYAASGQLPAQNLAALQAAAFGRSSSKSVVSPLDQRNLFSFETPKLRFGEGQQQHLSNSKQVNFLHGIPTNMEPKQLANFHQAANSFGINMQVGSHGTQGSSLMMQMAQPQSRSQIQNDISGSYVSRLPPSIGQPVVSNVVSNGTSRVLTRPVYNHQVSQTSPVAGISTHHSNDLMRNSFPLGGNSGISSLASKVIPREEAPIEIKGSQGGSNYDVYSGQQQRKSQDWTIQNSGLAFDTLQHANMRGNLDVSQAALVQQSFSSRDAIEQSRNSSVLPSVLLQQGYPSSGHSSSSSFGKGIFSGVEENGHRNMPNTGQQLNAYFTDTSPRVKAELLEGNFYNNLLPDQYDQEDLMSALLKHQEGIVTVENDFDFDGYPLDNLPV
ncbi:two-component response regulator ARR2 isoform X2 [Daucus carota subsp. sativus]|uniref:two-component response regulator ARR2 isoform X2 n=1 Tax=Daucus carota subsp. sativus TaxID=79200 RepID=UPI0007EF83E9|nr:PREDICTED: two-component response regulator ARR2-like isoform X2 [Daucus carota subsp. sativus]